MRYACPKCDSTDLRVEVEVVRKLQQDSDGSLQTLDIGGDEHWDNAAMMLCNACDFTAAASGFEKPLLWKRLNELSHKYGFNSPEARLLGAAADYLREHAPHETGGADAAPPRGR
jgi:hypothetical protein